jgi:outer membrane lipoprotein-sorting protein
VRVKAAKPATYAAITASHWRQARKEALEMSNSVLLHPDKFGVTYTYKGKEKVDDTDCFVLEQAFSDGTVNTLYVDTKTYLLYKTKGTTMGQMGGEVEQEMLFSDYKKVSGVMIAHTVTIIQDGSEFGVMTITDVKFNSGLEDSLFKME